jgi:hypothetical protein
MNFGAIWSEHRRFILSALAALVVFLIADSILGSVFFSKADAASQRENRLAQSLRTRKAPTKSDIETVTKTRDELKKRFEDQRARFDFQTAPEFVLKPDERDFDVFYNTRYQKLREELVEGGASLDVEIDPTLGLPEGTPSTRDDARDWLRALDVVRRVCRAAIDERVRAVRDIHANKAAANARSSSGWTEAPFLKETEVTMVVDGDASTVALFLEAIQRPPSPLVLKDARIEADKKNSRLAHADLRIVALGFESEKSETP